MPQSRGGEARGRAQARREAIARQERNRKLMFGGLWSGVAIVVILVVVFVVINQIDTRNGGKDVTAAAAASVSNDVTSIPESAFATAGVKDVQSKSAGDGEISGLTDLGAAPVLTNGLPTVIYVGGEFCPFCAAERWAIASALSRFGTLTGLQTTMSSGSDEDPNTATLSFVTTRFSSPYVAFSGTEQEDRARSALDTPPAAELAAFNQYSGGGYPFLTINDKYKAATAQYDPALLKGMTAAQIAAALQNPTSAVGTAILQSANVLTAGICQETGGKPGSVCNAAEVKAAGAYLNVKTGSSGSSSSSGS